MSEARPRAAGAQLGGTLDLQREDAELHVRDDAAWRPVVDRADREAGPLQLAKAGLDDPGAFVAERRVLGREAVVVGGDHELAVEPLRGLYLGRIEPGPATGVGGEVASEASRGEEVTGGSGMIGITFGQQPELGRERLEDQGPVPALALGLRG